MREHKLHPFLLFSLSLLLETFPIPRFLSFYFPSWVLLFFIIAFLYSTLSSVFLYGFMAGLFLDVILGTNIGSNILIFITIAFVLIKWIRVILQSPGVQLYLIILIIFFLYEVLNFILSGFIQISLSQINITQPVINTLWFIMISSIFDFLRIYKKSYES
ncbi:MAG: rod shape-determining protein MreD [Gammaproteobacteria bacterium]